MHVGTVELAGALADPEHVRRAVVPVAGQRVLPGECLLVPEDERLVAGGHLDGVELWGGLGVDAAGGHEVQGAIDASRHLLVATSLGARRDELLVPCVHAGQVAESTLGERPQQVQCGRRLMVRGEQTGRIGPSGLGCERDVVHHVATE